MQSSLASFPCQFFYQKRRTATPSHSSPSLLWQLPVRDSFYKLPFLFSTFDTASLMQHLPPFSGSLTYIMPPMPAPAAGPAGASSLMLATADSVVSRVDATLVAFCRALLVTFAGSRMPASTISTYSSL